MNRASKFVRVGHLLLAGALLGAAGAGVSLAQGSSAEHWCFAPQGQSSSEQMIRGCTQLIDSSATDRETVRQALMNRAAAYRDKREFSAALADINQAIRMKPNDANSIFARAFIYRAEGRRDAAIADYQTVLRLDPSYTEAREALRNLR